MNRVLDNWGRMYYTVKNINCGEGKQYPAGGREERERLVQAPGKPPEKSSLSGAAEGKVSRDGGPSVIGEGRGSARKRAAPAREARNQVVPRICDSP